MHTHRGRIALLVVTVVLSAACAPADEDTAPEAPEASRRSGTSTMIPESAAAPNVAPELAPETTTTVDGRYPPEADARAGGAPAAPAAPSEAGVYVPPAGRYVYDTSGYAESGTGPTRTRRPAPPESVDDVEVNDRTEGTEVRVRTTYPDDRGQETVVMVSAAEARLTRLSYRSTAGAVATEQAVHPDPPIPVARLPYVVGDRWESAWRDAALGIQGVGTGAVLRTETVTTGIGPVDAVVLEVRHRIRGTITGELTVTAWIDPTTGVLARQHVVTEIHDATGSSRSEVDRLLRTAPG